MYFWFFEEGRFLLNYIYCVDYENNCDEVVYFFWFNVDIVLLLFWSIWLYY